MMIDDVGNLWKQVCSEYLQMIKSEIQRSVKELELSTYKRVAELKSNGLRIKLRITYDLGSIRSPVPEIGVILDVSSLVGGFGRGSLPPDRQERELELRNEND
ncbi:jg14186 [Pararge aegeria aegeria]|uniref:Jg14186 protein n=1 Tax=Pararge aegeria aegeria TaxID=348720 RepID=A0A8S4SFY5_9NEOP|nr:jg14186 [Pararge aegeria aegeria]